MKSILSELIYAIEGYGENPKAVITSFKQDAQNPNKYYLEIVDTRGEPLTDALQKINDDKTEGAEDESN